MTENKNNKPARNLKEEYLKCDLPYERFLKVGEKNLSDTELLAVILRTGIKNSNVMDTAKSILNHPKIIQFGMPGLSKLTQEELRSIPGIGDIKAAQILCISELSKRMSASFSLNSESFNSPDKIAQRYMPLTRTLDKERVYAVYLDSKLKIIRDEIVSIGTVDQSILEPREIIRSAITCNSSKIFVLHNHPSGDPNPSKNDIIITKKLIKACSYVSIRLMDHIILGDNIYFSFMEHGLLQEAIVE